MLYIKHLPLLNSMWISDSPCISHPRAMGEFGKGAQHSNGFPSTQTHWWLWGTVYSPEEELSISIISPKSSKSSALLEIKLITTTDTEGWELSLHGTPYLSIFYIKFKWKFSFVRWEGCWKGSKTFKKLKRAIELNLDVKAMRCFDSLEDSKTFSQIRKHEEQLTKR